MVSDTRRTFMRVFAIGLVALLMGCPGAGPATPAPAQSDVDQTLAHLDQVGKNLKEFTAKAKLTEEDTAITGNAVIHSGAGAFQKKPDGNVRIHVLFDQRIANNVQANEKTEYL